MFSSGILPFGGNGDPDEPNITRWTFEDFEEYYDRKLGLAVIDANRLNQLSDESINGFQRPSSPRQLSRGAEDEKAISAVPLGSGAPARAIYERHLAAATGGANLDESGGQGDNPATGGRVLKPLPDFGNRDLVELAESITRDIFVGNVDVRWSDIKGLEGAKRLVKEAVVLPIKYPQYFTGLLAPWKGILLFGPPGTGKTMLAKAVATECNTTFFNISASSIVSKFRGDSEKLVRMLFELARHHAPSTIFLDEIDAILGQRGEGHGEHEASRRVKTELLVQMDGLAKSQDMVFLLAATNLPWELDHAMLRRLEKRILVPLPDPEARRAIFEHLLPAERAPDLDYDMFVEGTEGYSGSDLRILCKEAAMRPVRRLLSTLEVDLNGIEGESVVPEELPVPGPVTGEDVQQALCVTKPSANALAARYEKFNDDFGSQLTC